MAIHRVNLPAARSDYGSVRIMTQLPVIISRKPNLRLPVSGFSATMRATPVSITQLLSPSQQAMKRRVDLTRPRRSSIVLGFGDAVTDNFLLTQTAEAAALANYQQDKTAAVGMTLTSAQKSALADEYNRAVNWVMKYEALRQTAIAKYNTATTLAARTSIATQIKSYNLVISQQLPLLVAATAKVRSLGVGAVSAPVVAQATAVAVQTAQATVTSTANTIAVAQNRIAQLQATQQTTDQPLVAQVAQTNINLLQTQISAAQSQQTVAVNALTQAGIQPNSAKSVNSYTYPTPIPASRSAIPGGTSTAQLYNVGTLPLGLPGQAPQTDQATQFALAANAGNVSGITQPTASPWAAAGSSLVSSLVSDLPSQVPKSSFAASMPAAAAGGVAAQLLPGVSNEMLIIGAGALAIFLIMRKGKN